MTAPSLYIDALEARGSCPHAAEDDPCCGFCFRALIARARMAGRLLAALRMAVDFPESRATRAAAGAASVAARAAGIEPEP